MFKKLLFTAAAAAAVSVPLAGAAWAEPANNEPPGQRDTNSGQPGIPGVVGDVSDALQVNPNPGEAVPPGQGFKELQDGSVTVNSVPPRVITIEGGNVPERYADFINDLTGLPTGEKLPPGLGIKSGTPACKSGQTGGNLGLCN
jgi:hypothetical protein